MTPDRDPPRWKADPQTSEQMTDALKKLSARGPSSDQLARMAAAIGVPPPIVPVTPTASGVGGGTIAAISGTSAVIVLAVTAAIVWTPRAPAPVPRAPEPTHSAPRIEAREVEEAPPEIAIEEEPSEPAVTPRPRVRRAPPIATVPATEPSPEAPPDNETRLREEAALIARAEDALASDPLEALRLANEHRRQFGNGVMSQEREVIAIDALLRLNMRSAAQARANAFEQIHSGSVHARRIRRLLETR